MPLTANRTRRGYTLLFIVLVISLILTLLYIPLVRITSTGTSNTLKQDYSRHVYYATEAAIHDAVARIVATNGSWPPTGTTNQPMNIDNVAITRTITKNAGGDINILVDSRFRSINRDFDVDISATSPSSGTSPMDVVIVLDASGSMSNISSFPCDGTSQPRCEPMESARIAAKSLVSQIFAANPSARVSIVSFNDQATTRLAIDTSQSSNETYINNTIINNIIITDPLANTNIGDGFYRAKLELDKSSSTTTKSIVLLSDGSPNRKGNTASGGITSCTTNPIAHTSCSTDTPNNPPDPQSALGRAQLAANAGATIYTVGLGIISLNPNAHSMVARETLIQSATTANHYYDSPTSIDLAGIFTTIGQQILTQPQFNIQETY